MVTGLGERHTTSWRSVAWAAFGPIQEASVAPSNKHHLPALPAAWELHSCPPLKCFLSLMPLQFQDSHVLATSRLCPWCHVELRSF